jgi:hypothetical protein
MNSLRAAGVPEAVLAKLDPLKNKEFANRKDFMEELGQVLVRYKLTDKSLDALRAAGVPDGVLTKLDPLADKQFALREDFVAELGQVLEKEDLARWQDRVVSHARVVNQEEMARFEDRVENQASSGFLPGALRAFLVFAALLVAAGAVSRRLQTARQAPEERVTSAAIVAVAALVVLLAYTATPEWWDSIRMLLVALALVALFGSVLILLPRIPRRIIASLLVLFHFGGIATAVTALSPGTSGQPAPWLSTQLWIRVYRPYLQLMYLTNAYHFYSPDPGPPMLAWFYVRYDDGTARWIRIPVRNEAPVALNYQRLLALADGLSAPMPRIPLSISEAAEIKERTGVPYDHDTWETIVERRRKGFYLYSPPLPLPEDAPEAQQYSEPNVITKGLIQSCAMHVARNAPHPTNPNAKVKDIRVYRVIHRLISPQELAQGYTPLFETLYSPYYLGRFNPDGELLDPQDPFLYWYVPIVIVPTDYGKPGKKPRLLLTHQPSIAEGKILNGLEIHVAAETVEKLNKGQKKP